MSDDINQIGRYCENCRRRMEIVGDDGACTRCIVGGYVPARRRRESAAEKLAEAVRDVKNRWRIKPNDMEAVIERLATVLAEYEGSKT